MSDDIIQFSPGEKVTAEETNENNLLLKEWALDNSASEAYIDGKIATLTSNLNSQISSINTQISSINSQISTKLSATTSKGANGYIKLSNGIIIQWGYASGFNNGTTKTITLPTAYAGTGYQVAGSTNYEQTAGDKRSTFKIDNQTTTTFKITSYFEQGSNYVIRWIAVGS